MPSQVSTASQTPAAARQVVPSGWTTSDGQATALPGQFSATSQEPAEARHTVVVARNESAGQALATPSQLSATSHGPADGRQTPVLFVSAGQAAALPVHVSAGSHAPADARHTVLLGWNALAGQALLAPSQLSVASQGPVAARQTAVVLASAGHVVAPSQVSATSQAPAAVRQTVAGAAAAYWQPLAGLHESVVQTFPSSQLRGGPPTQAPAEHASAVVHALPSSQVVPFGTGTWTTPRVGEHESAVQALPSSMTSGVPAAQMPAPSQVSLPLQTLPSEQDVPAATATCIGPVAGSQLSAVQGFPSSMTTGAPGVHAPASSHVSMPLHALPSEHEVPAAPGGLEHCPDTGSRVPATWHASSGVQGGPPVP